MNYFNGKSKESPEIGTNRWISSVFDCEVKSFLPPSRNIIWIQEWKKEQVQANVLKIESSILNHLT